jgi:hypothetical protein
MPNVDGTDDGCSVPLRWLSSYSQNIDMKKCITSIYLHIGALTVIIATNIPVAAAPAWGRSC